MVSLQQMFGIEIYKTVWTMGHKIRNALADRDVNYKLVGLMRWTTLNSGPPSAGGVAAGRWQGKVVEPVETPENKRRFAVMYMLP